jgi:hypothetical protein
LDPKAVYKLESVGNRLAGMQAQYSGAYLMGVGVTLNLRGDYDATAVILERQ